jgi:hypothetical protein
VTFRKQLASEFIITKKWVEWVKEFSE